MMILTVWILTEIIGKNNEDYIITIKNLIEYNYQIGNHIKTEEYIYEYFFQIGNLIINISKFNMAKNI